MTFEEVSKMLVGKEIQEIAWHEYLDGCAIDEITFTDGTVVSLSGRADEAFIDCVQTDGEFWNIDR